METIRVLVFPCGSEIGLEYHKALKDVRYIELYGASSVSDHGEFAYKNYIGGAPYISDPEFSGWLAGVVADNSIDVICPAMDSVIPVLAELAPQLKCKALVPSVETARICRDKIKTYEFFADEWFNPDFRTDIGGIETFPVALKPAKGQGSQGFKVISSREELAAELDSRDEPQVICEYLSGPEYTIDCFSDKEGKLRFASQRVRERTKAGISVRSQTMRIDDEVRKIALEINACLSMRGVWFFQLKLNAKGEYRLLEVAPRVAGTMCLERALGVNLPALAILDAMGYDVSIDSIDCEAMVDRAFENCFSVGYDYDSLYLDYDDTLVCDGKVNLDAIRLVYQCRNNGIPIVLITRHETDILEALVEVHIDERLFEEIIHIDKSARKSDYIDARRNPIFIDDSFVERSDVSSRLGIIALGPESIETLLDRRQ